MAQPVHKPGQAKVHANAVGTVTNPTVPQTEPTSSPATSIDHDASAPAWTQKFEDGWKMLGELFRGQFRQPASGPFKDAEERDWWLVRGNVARMSVALEKQNWQQLVFAIEGFLRDLGVSFTKEQMMQIAVAVKRAAETLPLVSGSPESPPPALPKQPEKE